MAKLHFRPYVPNQTVLFPQKIDENMAADDPIRMVNAVVDNLNLDNFKKIYKETDHPAYYPKMMPKVIIYAYMNNIHSCRKTGKLLLRDIHYIRLADKGFISLDVKHTDGTRIESKANKYTFVWRKTVEKNRAKLPDKISVHPLQGIEAQQRLMRLQPIHRWAMKQEYQREPISMTSPDKCSRKSSSR